MVLSPPPASEQASMHWSEFIALDSPGSATPAKTAADRVGNENDGIAVELVWFGFFGGSKRGNKINA
jgi:hypothetical protein